MRAALLLSDEIAERFVLKQGKIAQVDVFEGDIVDCPEGKDGAHSVESLTTDLAVLVANK